VVHNAILVSQDKLDASNENRITIHFELTSDPIMLLMDAAQMEVAILELINNSIEAINDQGQISVRLWQEISTSNGSIGDAVIEVADTGQGIIQSNVSNIFNPFFTTKPNGTGLGLSAVKRIARAHDGNVEVISYPGKGTACYPTNESSYPFF
jgi:signal transduction histidine kinase